MPRPVRPRLRRCIRNKSIIGDPNRLDDKQHIVRLLGQVIMVSLETITITVQSATSPITFGAPVFIGGNFQFSAKGVTPGNSIVLQSSTNLTFPGNWVALRTNVAGGSSISFTNPATAGACFFRVV
jgi:hypothetical protein